MQVERCVWHGNTVCCKIIVIDQMPPAMAKKIAMGVEANLLVGLCHPHIVQTFQIYHVLKDPSGAEQADDINLKEIWIVQARVAVLPV